MYSLPMFLYLAYCTEQDQSKFFSRCTVTFVTSFAIVQLFLLSIFYHTYGFDFLYESYLYHVIRADTRHNFSPCFYVLHLKNYLTDASIFFSATKFLTFIPQTALSLLISIKYYHNLELCLFLQTIGFVMFNKVCTSQYFLWYLWLLPLIYPNLKLSWKYGACLFGMWLAGQGLWLFTGYLVEFESQNYFLAMHFCSLFFLLMNAFIMKEIVVYS